MKRIPWGRLEGGRMGLPDARERIRGADSTTLPVEIRPLGLAPIGQDAPQRQIQLVRDELVAISTPEASPKPLSLFEGIRSMQQHAMEDFGVLPVLVGGAWIRLLTPESKTAPQPEIVGYDPQTHTLTMRNLNLKYGAVRLEEGGKTRVDFDAICFPVVKNGDDVRFASYEQGKNLSLGNTVTKLIDEYAAREEFPRAGFEEVFYVNPADRLKGLARLRDRMTPHMPQINSNIEIFPPESQLPGGRKVEILQDNNQTDERGRIVYQVGNLRQEVGWNSHEIVRIVVEGHPELGSIYSFNPRALKKRYEGVRNIGVIKPSDRKKIASDMPISKIANDFDNNYDHPQSEKYKGWDKFVDRLKWAPTNPWLQIKRFVYWAYWKTLGKRAAHSNRLSNLDKKFSYHPHL